MPGAGDPERAALIAWHGLVLEAGLEAGRRGRTGAALAGAARRAAAAQPLGLGPDRCAPLVELQLAVGAVLASPAAAEPCAGDAARRYALREAVLAAAAVLPPVPRAPARPTLRFRADIDG